MFNLKSYISLKNSLINEALDKILTDTSKRIVSAMKYSLMAGGKRIRPVLCMAAAEAVGGNADDVLIPACAIEMIHTYSLIHDDLPAMDNDDLRRGKPTCHKFYDEATAILAGDALLTFAFELLSSLPCRTEEQAIRLLKVICMISQAAGYKGMIEGQILDIASEGILLDLNRLEIMHSLKTGAMIEASVCSGAILAGATPEQTEQLKIYSKNIGLAFQVADDILNVEGDPALMGKAVGTDKERKKSTYPSILGLDESRDMAKQITGNALRALDIFDEKADPLREIAKYIIERKK